MKYAKNDAIIRLRACSSLGSWSTTVTVRLEWQESYHDLRYIRALKLLQFCVLGTTTTRLEYIYMQMPCSRAVEFAVTFNVTVHLMP